MASTVYVAAVDIFYDKGDVHDDQKIECKLGSDKARHHDVLF